MLRTMVFGGAAAVIGLGLFLGLLFGRDACSYVKTSVVRMQQSAKESVPIDFEIERARKMVGDLEPEIRRNMHLIAKEEVEVARLEREASTALAQLTKDREDILRLKADLDSGTSNFVYAGRSYSAKQVKADLANRFERFKTKEATTDNLQKVLHARQRGLSAAREKLEAMLAAKRQLEVDIENLEARLKMVQVAQTSSEFNFDDSQLARTKDLIRDIQTRIDVAERMVGAEGYFHDQIPLDEPHDTDLSDEIADYFGEGRGEVESFVGAAAAR